MLRLLKRVAWMGFLAAGLSAAQAFSLLGPTNTEPWQVHDLGYQLNSDVGGPMNIGEDYRRNTPVLYYAFDENFLDYFGSNGVWAVDQAFAIMNSLQPVSSYSADLSEVPLEVPEAITRQLEGLEASWQRPDGEELIDAMSVGRRQARRHESNPCHSFQ